MNLPTNSHMKFNRIQTLVFALFTLLANIIVATALQADAGLEAFFKSYLDESFRLRPLEATRLGDHRFDSQLEELTPEARTKWLELTRKTLAELPQKVDYSKLSRASQIDFEMFQHDLKFSEWLTQNTHPYEEDPRIYNGYINDSIYLLLAQSSLPRETNVANCIARMALIPKVIAAAKQNLKNPPRVHTETAIRQNRGAIGFYEKDIFEFAGKTRQLAALKAAATPVVAALKDYQKFLENELLPRANGEWRLGKEKFSQKLDLELDAAVNADQVMADAEAEFARVEREMYVISRQLWSRYFAREPLPPDDQDGRRATIRKVIGAIAKEHSRPDQLTAEMKHRVASLKKFITANNILRLPEPDHCQVVE